VQLLACGGKWQTMGLSKAWIEATPVRHFHPTYWPLAPLAAGEASVNLDWANPNT